MPDISSFRIAVPESDLADLRARIARTRWPNEPAARGWNYGADLGWMKTVAAYWRDAYDWRRWEARLNAVPNFHVRLGGKDLHFMMERGSGSDPLPIILSHGWPGSVVEFLDVIEPLAHPERFGGDVHDAFTVVVPSLPGFGFSQAPDSPITARDIAHLWADLMGRVLGFDRYVAQGGDWGALITSWLAIDHPQRLQAIHLNSTGLAGGYDRPYDPAVALDDEESAWQAEDAKRRRGVMAYQAIQGEEPQTLAYGLTDSPVGLAAWVLERFQAWTVRGSDEPPPFALDHLLTNVMLYWIGGINAANWLYVSIANGTARRTALGERVQVPAGFTLCPADNTVPPPNRWLARIFANIVYRNDAERGGHFLALEQGPLYIEELRHFFRRFR